MGLTQSKPPSLYQKQYTIISRDQNQLQTLVRHKKSSKQYMLRRIITKTQQQLQQRLNILSKRRKIKSEHLLSIVDYDVKQDDKICGKNKYIELLVEYPFQNLFTYTERRKYGRNLTARSNQNNHNQPVYFMQHQLWSILYSCCQGLEKLYLSDLTHQSITKECVFIDKDGVVKIGDPIVSAIQRNYSKAIQMIQKQKKRLQKQLMNSGKVSSRKQSIRSNSQNFQKQGNNQSYNDNNNNINNDKNKDKQPDPKQNIKKLNHMKKITFLNPDELTQQQPSVIISPELISLVKDHQYYYFDKQKSDIFILGALMIQLCVLQDICSISMKDNSFKKNLKELLNQDRIMRKYSRNFISLIQEMVRVDPKDRPTLSEIVEKIQEFSIKENSKIDTNSERDLSREFTNQKGNLKNIEQTIILHKDEGENGININNGNFMKNKNQSSFSPVMNLNLNLNNNNPNYPESAVKSLFSKTNNLNAIQIKHTYSPSIIPLSNNNNNNILVNLNNNNLINKNTSITVKNDNKCATPFHQLFMNISGDRNNASIQKQSIVQGKYSLWENKNGQNNNINNGLQKFSQLQFNQFIQLKKNQLNQVNQNQGERFSINKFGKIQLPIATVGKIDVSSLQTSMLPTPRFQIPTTTIFKDSVNNSLQYTTSNFQQISNMPNFQNNHSHTNNFISSQPTTFNILQNLNRYNINSSSSGNLIIEQPYFSNSSVSYTLPKYGSRPESHQTTTNQNENNQRQNNHIPHSISLNKHKKKQSTFSEQYNSNKSSMINTVTRLIQKNQKIDKSYSKLNDKNQDKIQDKIQESKKQTSKRSSLKKYNKFKNQLSEQLQQIDRQDKQISYKPPKASSPSLHPNTFLDNISSSNTISTSHFITSLQYQPEFHSKYVEQFQQGGSKFEGFKVNGKKHGNGKLYFVDGGYYEGQFKDDLMEGEGKLYYNQKDIAYEGQFKENNFHGYGVLYNDKPKKFSLKFDFANMNNLQDYWHVFKGHFKDDQKAGKCIITLTNGEQFEGYCQDNTIEGNGRFKTLNGEFIDGVWFNNMLVQIKGEGKLHENYNEQN